MNRTVLKRFFWILLAAPYFKPAVLGVLEGTGWLETIFDIWRMGAAVAAGMFRRSPAESLSYIFANNKVSSGLCAMEAMRECLSIDNLKQSFFLLLLYQPLLCASTSGAETACGK